MSRRTDSRATWNTVVLAAATSVSLLLTACSSSWVTGSSSGPAPSSTSGSTSTSAPTASSAPTTSSSAGASTAEGGSSIARVSCRNDSCSLVLAGRETRVQVLEATIDFVAVREGQATLQVDQEEVTCTEGADVSAGSLELSCTRVTEDRVEFTARRR